jgi:hypothetical protein
MSGDPNPKIEQIIEQGYDFKFGDYISRGFDILQKNFGGFILFSILSVLIMGVVIFIPFLGMMAVFLLLGPALMAGIYIVAHKLRRGEPAEFGDFFKGFDFAGQLILVSLVSFLIGQILSIPYYFANAELYSWYMEIIQEMMSGSGNIADIAEYGEPPQPSAWTYLLMIPSIYISVAYNWAILFVVFYRMKFWDALEASRKVITKNWFMVFLFLIVAGLIMIAGAFLFCIGIFVTFPAYLCMNYAAFEDVTQLNADPGEDENIEQHLIV